MLFFVPVRPPAPRTGQTHVSRLTGCRPTTGRLVVGLSLVVAATAAPMVGADPPAVQPPEPQTLTVIVVDPTQYLRTGLSTAGEASYLTAHGGQTLVLLDQADDTLYFLLTSEPGKDPNERFYDYLGQTVRVTGLVYQRSGLKGIVVLSVESLPENSLSP